MKLTLSRLRRPFRVQYRLAILYRGETVPRQWYAVDGRKLRKMANDAAGMAYYWTLYKTGPFWLSERPVDWGEGATIQQI